MYEGNGPEKACGVKEEIVCKTKGEDKGVKQNWEDGTMTDKVKLTYCINLQCHVL